MAVIFWPHPHLLDTEFLKGPVSFMSDSPVGSGMPGTGGVPNQWVTTEPGRRPCWRSFSPPLTSCAGQQEPENELGDLARGECSDKPKERQGPRET